MPHEAEIVAVYVQKSGMDISISPFPRVRCIFRHRGFDGDGQVRLALLDALVDRRRRFAFLAFNVSEQMRRAVSYRLPFNPENHTRKFFHKSTAKKVVWRCLARQRAPVLHYVHT